MTFGPVQMLVVGFDNIEMKGTIRAELDRLREADTVRLVDLVVVRKSEDGTVERILHSDLTVEGAEAGAVLGAEAMEDGHVFSEEDHWYVDDAIPPGTAAAVALLEHRWAIPLRDAIRDAGGFLLADAWLHPADLVAAGMRAAVETTE
jgi:hypothetical protein